MPKSAIIFFIKNKLFTDKETLICMISEVVSFVVFLTMGIVTARIINFEAIGKIETLYFIEGSFYALYRTMTTGGFIYRRQINQPAVRTTTLLISIAMALLFILFAQPISQFLFQSNEVVPYIIMLSLSSIFLIFYYENTLFLVFERQSKGLIWSELIYVITQVATAIGCFVISQQPILALGVANIVSYIVPYLLFSRHRLKLRLQINLGQYYKIFQNNFSNFIEEFSYAFSKLAVIYVIFKYQSIIEASLMSIIESVQLILYAPLSGLGNRLSTFSDAKTSPSLRKILLTSGVLLVAIYSIIFVSLDLIIQQVGFDGDHSYAHQLLILNVLSMIVYIPSCIMRSLNMGLKQGRVNNKLDTIFRVLQIVIKLIFCRSLLQTLYVDIVIYAISSITFIYLFCKAKAR